MKIVAFIHHRMKNRLFKSLFYVWDPTIIQLKLLESIGHFCNTAIKWCSCLWDKYETTARSNARCFSTPAQQARSRFCAVCFGKLQKLLDLPTVPSETQGILSGAVEPAPRTGTFCNCICANIRLFCLTQIHWSKSKREYRHLGQTDRGARQAAKNNKSCEARTFRATQLHWWKDALLWGQFLCLFLNQKIAEQRYFC